MKMVKVILKSAHGAFFTKDSQATYKLPLRDLTILS